MLRSIRFRAYLLAILAAGLAAVAMGRLDLTGLRRRYGEAFVAAALTAAVALAAAALTWARHGRALRRLAAHADALARGERPEPPTGPSELRHLAAGFQRLSGRAEQTADRYTAILEQVPGGVAVVDPASLELRFVNHAFAALLGQSPGPPLTGRPLTEVFPGAEALDLPGVCRRVLETGTPHLEAEHRFARGHKPTATWRVAVVAVNSALAGRELLVLVSDITDAVRTRERIEAERRRMEAVLRTLPVGVFVSDSGGTLVHANEEAKRIWGGRAPLRGPGGHREYHGRRADTGAPLAPGEWPIARALRSGEPVERELIRIERFDGSEGLILASAAPLFSPGGAAGTARKVGGAVAVLQDVTTLERTLASREEVLGLVSHDLRTPLSSITLGATALARLSGDPAAALERARALGTRMEASAKRMARLIDDVVDLGALDEGRLKMQPETCHPLDLMGNAAESLGEAARAKGVALCLAAEPALPDVHCDRDRIQQVLAGLVSHAIDSTDEGAVCLAAEARGDAVVFRVRDGGADLSPEDLPALFERPSPGGPRRRRTSLGLAVSRALVEAHGGAIWAESAPGQGTTISFSLPPPVANEARPGDAA
jgi:PAS domain S-box-containing protein